MLVIAWKRRLQFPKRQQILYKSSGFLLSTSSSSLPSSSPPLSSCSHSILVFNSFNGVLCISCAYFSSKMSLFFYFYDTIVKLLVYGGGSVQHRPHHFPHNRYGSTKTTARFNRKQFLSMGELLLHITQPKRVSSVFCSALQKLLR